MVSPITVPSCTPISQLNPDLRPDESSVTGIVTLIWPYASSKKTFSFLLVEPDFRLRSIRGQVRVHFQGSSAKAVARSGISSGDQLLLSLKGAQWAKDSTAATTPGKGIDWQLQFEERLELQVSWLRGATELLLMVSTRFSAHRSSLYLSILTIQPRRPSPLFKPRRQSSLHPTTTTLRPQLGDLSSTRSYGHHPLSSNGANFSLQTIIHLQMMNFQTMTGESGPSLGAAAANGGSQSGHRALRGNPKLCRLRLLLPRK